MAVGATPHVGDGRPPSLDELLVRSGRRDRSAFTDLYDRLAPRVFGLVSCLVRDPGEAERISCDAFLEVWRRAATYDPASSGAAAWVLGTARRLAVPASRLAHRSPGAPVTSQVHDPFLRASGLTRPQARAVHLAWFDGLDHRRIEAEMGPGEPAAALITGALRTLAPAGPR